MAQALLWARLLLVLQPQDAESYEIEAWSVQSWKEADGTEVAYLSGQVRVRSASMDLWADRAMTWKRPGSKNRGGFDEVYAEGNVQLKNKMGITQVRQLFLDLLHDRAVAVDFVFRGKAESPPVEFVVRAQEVLRLGKDRYVADRISVSSCTFATPHMEVRLSQAVVRAVSSAAREAARAIQFLPQAANWSIEAKDATAWIGPVPFFYFPGFTYELGMEFLLRKLTAGDSRRFGWYVYTEWGFSLYRTDRDDEPRRRWADVEWTLDWREERGWAWGFNPRWKLDRLYGYVDSYGMDDLGLNELSSFDRQFLPGEEGPRGRARFFNRWNPAEAWTVDLEMSYLSDRTILAEFFRKEFLTGKVQETLIYGRWSEGNLAAVAQAKVRQNPFLTQVEQLPRVQGWWLGEPLPVLGRWIHYSQETQLGNFRFRPDEALPPNTFRTWRFDTQHELFLPVDLVWIQINGFGLGRYTWWENDLLRRGTDRTILTAGGDAAVTAWAVHPWRSESLGLRDVRHIALFRISYAENLYADASPSHFFPIDSRDALNEFEELSFEFRQKFQTRREDGSVHEFLFVSAEIEYYPEHARDAAAVNPNSFLHPFNWISVNPPAATPLDARRFSGLWWKASFTPAWILRVEGVGEINTAEGSEDYRNLSLSVQPHPWVQLSLAHTYVKHGAISYSAGVTWTVEPHWAFVGWTSYDFRERRFLNTQIDVIRHFHDWSTMVRFYYDAGEHDLRVLFLIEPKIFRALGWSSKLN